MSLRFAILTSLNERPATGLELTRRFDRSIGYFWSSSHQQIYRDLGRLEADGFVRELERAQNERGQPRRFAITESGREELTEWIGGIDDEPRSRDSLMVRVRAAASLGPEKAREAVAHRLAIHEQTLRDYREIEERDFSDHDRSSSTELMHAVLRAGIEAQEAWARWCRDTLERIDQLATD